MANKSITRESLANFDTEDERQKYRERENIRAFIEEFGGIRAKRLESEISFSTYIGTTRPYLYDTPGDYFLRGNQDYKKET